MRKSLIRGVLWSLVLSMVLTSVSWLVLGKGSPLNHGIPPDVHDKSFILPFLVANLPAGIVYVNVVGKHGPEWGYFVFIFVKWFSLGTSIAMVKAYSLVRNPS